MPFTTSYDLERSVAQKMSPSVVLVCLAATCAAQQMISNCTEGATEVGCNKTKYDSFQRQQVELQTEYLCKEATRVVLHWRSEKVPISGIDDYDSYFVNVYLANENPRRKVQGDYSEPHVPYIKFFNLTPSTAYTFGIMLTTKESNEPMEIFTKETYTTLSKNVDKLPNVTHSDITNPVAFGDEVRTNFSWTPVQENVCSYEIVVINRNGSFGEHPKYIVSRAQDLRTVELTHLRFSSLISVGVYPTIEDDRPEGVGHVEGKPFWMTFTTPDCVEFYGWNYNICKPLPPKNVSASVKECKLDLTWAPSDHPPPYYQIYAYPTNPKRNRTIIQAIPGYLHHFKESTHEMGEYLKVLLAGRSNSGSSVAVSLGVENDCTPTEADVPYGPTTHLNNTIHPSIVHNDTPVTAASVVSASQKNDGDSSSVFLTLITECLILITALLGSFGGYKVYKARKASAPQPVQESCEMIQPLAIHKSEDKDSDSNGKASSVEDAGEFEVRRQSLHLKEVVGEGAFGVVRRAHLVLGNDQREVAVKMLRDDASGEDKKQLKLELEVMKSVGTHHNIVCLVGFCSSNHMLVVEYCSLGDLQNYLRDIWRSKNWAKDVYKKNNPGRSIKNQNVVSNLLYNKTEVEKKQLNVTIFDLISLARQVALGMEYLSSNKVVHRDLAARNILLNEDLTAKISDFGLSRDVYEENMYRHKGVRRLPVKWMAIECLAHQMFTSQSDVWSFGILLWEIMTLGGCPYPSLQSAQVYKFLLRGERLERPKLCPKNLYDIMYECWDSLPHQRPTFSQLVNRLEAMLQADSQHRYLELDEVMVNYSHLYDASHERDDLRVKVNHQKHDSESPLQQVVSV